ncbi:MAG: hypothetical protein NC548_33570 [Lachnospiraceae bacterium]|nr:hypothetical protein [Lachnospiraceae bacterium]MCM1232732.1 hypothetical protein [Ruminococcus flavefaciens]
MAYYTMTLKTIIESLNKQTQFSTISNINDLINVARPLIFNFNYNYFAPENQDEFEKQFLKYFYFYEIGQETFARWQLTLENHLNFIMPEFNYLYQASKDYDLFNDVAIIKKQVDERNINNNYTHDDSTTIDDVKDTTNKTDTTSISDRNQTNDNTTKETVDTNNTNNTTSNAKNVLDFDGLRKQSDYPQSSLEDMLNGRYLTNAEKTENGQVETGDFSSNSTDKNLKTTDYSQNMIEHSVTDFSQNTDTTNKMIANSVNKSNRVKTEVTWDTNKQDFILSGKQGKQSYLELLFEYGQLINNFNGKIIESCKKLFMGVSFYE